MSPQVAPAGEFYDAADFRRRFPDGRIGSSPQLATVEAGERFCKLAAEALNADLKKMLLCSVCIGICIFASSQQVCLACDSKAKR